MAGRSRKAPGVDQLPTPDLNGLITAWVLDSLGKPGHLHQVQVRHRWERHYRVNVFVGEDRASATIAHNYFVVRATS